MNGASVLVGSFGGNRAPKSRGGNQWPLYERFSQICVTSEVFFSALAISVSKIPVIEQSTNEAK